MTDDKWPIRFTAQRRASNLSFVICHLSYRIAPQSLASVCRISFVRLNCGALPLGH
jgi:hypothetical protein